MVQAAIPNRSQIRRVFGVMRRREESHLNRQTSSVREAGGRSISISSRGLLPNGDPPSVTLWGED